MHILYRNTDKQTMNPYNLGQESHLPSSGLIKYDWILLPTWMHWWTCIPISTVKHLNPDRKSSCWSQIGFTLPIPLVFNWLLYHETCSPISRLTREIGPSITDQVRFIGQGFIYKEAMETPCHWHIKTYHILMMRPVYGYYSWRGWCVTF